MATQGGEVTTPPAVEVANATKNFGARTVLDGIDLSIRPGEFVALLGASGTGKTTLLRVLADLDRMTAGTVVVPTSRSVVFQEPRLVSSLNVWRNVVVDRRFGKAARSLALRALEEVGLSERANAWPHTLSGGEAQRTALARALVRDPDLLLLDEPFAALDALTRLKMHDLVIALWERHRPAVLLVTHDVDEAIAIADRVVVLVDGQIGFDENVGLPRPRDRGHARFSQLRTSLLTTLGVHQRPPTDPEAPKP
jgi:sulfonate transport system ATP-binding protein